MRIDEEGNVPRGLGARLVARVTIIGRAGRHGVTQMSDTMALRETANAFLAADARVASFEIATSPEGRLDIAARASASWVAAGRADAHAALETRMLAQWRMVYDRSYRWDKVVRPPNFDAWVSGFTGAAIPVERMRIWLGDVLAQMRGVPHARVLEIGCGVGLVAAALAPGGGAYDGIDFSEEAIASLGAWVATKPALAHVRLAQRAAHELDGLDIEGVDLAVMNSVVQYFPDADYLVRVLVGAAARIAAGGAIFLGDLRAAALLPMRATCVAAARAKDGATIADVRADAVAVMGLARELAIDPGFLETLGAPLPRLGAVQFSLKPEAADHELSGYRFDAMLRLDSPRVDAAPTMAAATLGEIVAGLDARPDAVAVLGLANARLASDVALARAVATAATASPLAALELATDPAAIEPGALAAIAATRGYTVELRFTPGCPEGRFDALFCRFGTRARWPAAATPRTLTNDPLGDDIFAKLRRDLQASLDAELGGRGLARLSLTP